MKKIKVEEGHKTYKYSYRGEFSFRPLDILCVVLAMSLIVAGLFQWCS